MHKNILKMAGAAGLIALLAAAGYVWIGRGGAPRAGGNVVRVTGAKGSWSLEVNGRPFFIQGVGCGIERGSHGEDYLQMAKDMGANSVRTWGSDQGTQRYLDRAARLGLLVDAGLWMNHVDAERGFSYLRPGGDAYLRKKRAEILDYVRKYRHHPAVLMWNIGNEVLTFAKSDEEKIAFARFLEDVIRDVKKIDPDHPVIYTEAALAYLKYLLAYTPSLDIIGVNSYGSVRVVKGSWDARGIDKPFVITEFGPHLPMESQKDENSRSIELKDRGKAMLYGDLGAQVREFKGYDLGGFAFHIGETTQDSISWWNLNQGPYKRESYWKVYEMYTGRPRPYELPRVQGVRLSKTQGLKPGEKIDAEIVFDSPSGEGLEFGFWMSTSKENILEYYVNHLIDPQAKRAGPNTATLTAPSQPGIYRVYGYIKDGRDNLSSVSRTIQVV